MGVHGFCFFKKYKDMKKTGLHSSTNIDSTRVLWYY